MKSILLTENNKVKLE